MKLLSFAAILMILNACGPEATREEQAIQAAHQHARKQFHYSGDIRKRPPTVEDLRDRWRIQFHPRPGYVGGAVEVVVRKSDLAVIDSIGTQ